VPDTAALVAATASESVPSAPASSPSSEGPGTAQALG
jgi:hypothetical protein